MQHDWVQWIPWSMIECSGFYAAWPKASRLNAVDSMQRDWLQVIHALWRNGSWLYAVESMQRGPRHPDWIQWILWGMAQSIPMECSGFHALWLNAVYSIQGCKIHPDWMQWIPFSVIECSIPWSVKKWNPIECSGFYAASFNAVDFMQHDWMQ